MVVVFGEALVDLLVDFPSDSVTSPGVSPVPGGCGLNLAVGLARLDCPVSFIGGLSRDAFGRFLAGRMQAAGVGLSASVTSTQPTRLVTVTCGPDGEPYYSFYGGQTADLEPPAPHAMANDTRTLAVCSYPSLFAPGLEACLSLAHAQSNRLVSFDPNIRPGLIDDPEGWRTGFEALSGVSHIIKASMADLRALWGDGCDELAWARRMLAWREESREESGPVLIVLTDGARGARLINTAGMIAMPAPRVDIVDTVGAGDAFHAALLAGLAERGLDAPAALAACDLSALEPVLAQAVLAGTLTCMRPGADPPDRKDLAARASS
jgi:fructokinase